MIFIDAELDITATATTRHLPSATAAVISLSGRPDHDIRKVRHYATHPDSRHVALFGYTHHQPSDEELLSLMAEGLCDIFEYPEMDEWIIARALRAGVMPFGNAYPRYRQDQTYSVFIYDDSSAVIMGINERLHQSNVKVRGRTQFLEFEADATGADADIYLVDLLHSDQCVGIDMIRELASRVNGAIVAHSRMTDPSIKLQCLDAGAHGYIEKSTEQALLIQKLKPYLAVGAHLKRTRRFIHAT